MAVIWCFPAMKMNLRQWSSCKEMVFVCVIWSFDDMGLGEQVILSDKESKGGYYEYYNKDGVPFLSKEQVDRCINGKDWKKIVSVSDKVKSDLEKVVKQDFISSNGAYIPEESKRHDVIKQYLNTIPSEQRNSASWTLSRMAGDYASRMETLVKKNNPGWKPGDAFDTSILDQMDDTLCGLDFKV